MKKIIQCLLTALILITCFCVPAKAEVTNDYDKGSFTVRATFDEFTTRESTTWDFEYNDRWFLQDASIYNHKLARLSFGMAVSAFRPHFDPKTTQDPGLHLRDFLVQCGFRKLRSDDYDKNPSLYTVSTVISHKTLLEGNQEYILLAVGVCGGGYTNEWLSNFTVGYDSYHIGFYSAAKNVFDRLFGYIARNGLQDQRLKVWVSGYSRAAAVSNVFAQLVTDTEMFDNKDVFALCDYNNVYEVRLKEAINKGWLCPFRYYGIYDGTIDYSTVNMRNGVYDEKDLEEK